MYNLNVITIVLLLYSQKKDNKLNKHKIIFMNNETLFYVLLINPLLHPLNLRQNIGSVETVLVVVSVAVEAEVVVD